MTSRFTIPQSLVALAIAAFLVVFLVYPVATVVYVALTNSDGSLTFAHFGSFMQISLMRESFTNSLYVAVMTVLASSLIAVPIAYFTARFEFRGAILVQTLGVLPLIMPAFVGAAAMQLLFGRSGSANLLLGDWFDFTIPFMDGLNGVIFVESIHYFPFVLMNLTVALGNIDTAMEESAQNLGASGLRLFRRVVFPLAMPGYVAGASLVFIKVFDDLGTPLVLNVTNMLAPQAYLRVTSIGIEDPIGYVICFILVGFSIAAMWGSTLFLRGREYATLQRGAAGIARRRLSPWRTAFAYFWIVLVLLLVLSPHIGVLLLSLSKVWSYSLVPEIYTLDNFRTVFTDSTRMIFNTLAYCGLAALVDVIIGTAIAYLVLRTQLPGRQLLDHMATVALAMPGVVLGIGYLRAFRGVEIPFTDTALTASWLIFVLAYLGAAPALRAAFMHGGAAAGTRFARGGGAEPRRDPRPHHPARGRPADGRRHAGGLRHQFRHRSGGDFRDHAAHQPRKPGADVLRNLPVHAVDRRPRAGRGAGGDRSRDRGGWNLSVASFHAFALGGAGIDPSALIGRHHAIRRQGPDRTGRAFVRQHPGAARHRFVHRARRVLRAARPLGLRQVDAAAPHRRVQPSAGGTGADRRRGRHAACRPGSATLAWCSRATRSGRT